MRRHYLRKCKTIFLKMYCTFSYVCVYVPDFIKISWTNYFYAHLKIIITTQIRYSFIWKMTTNFCNCFTKLIIHYFKSWKFFYKFTHWCVYLYWITYTFIFVNKSFRCKNTAKWINSRVIKSAGLLHIISKLILRKTWQFHQSFFINVWYS